MIRPSDPGDGEAICELLDRAFDPSLYDSNLRTMVSAGEITFYEWLEEEPGGRVVGYVLFTPAFDGDGGEIGYHLGPVAVDPAWQGQGIGSRLIRESLEAEQIRRSAVFVLGDPAFYERFGFAPLSSAICPFDESNQHFRALRWTERGEVFKIGYHPAFFAAEG